MGGERDREREREQERERDRQRDRARERERKTELLKSRASTFDDLGYILFMYVCKI